MQIQIQKIVRPLDLGEFAPEYDGQCVQVWLNPPKSMTDERIQHSERANAINQAIDAKLSGKSDVNLEPLLTELAGIGQTTLQWLATVWSQGADEQSHWSAEDIRQLFEADEVLYKWLLQRTWAMMLDYRDGQKKRLLMI